MSRSMASVSVVPAFCWSVATSRNSGSSPSLARIFGAQAFNSSRLTSCTVYWNWVRAERPPTVTSCATCRNSRAPLTWASLGRSRAMIWNASAVRSSRGLRVMNMRPEFCAEAPTPAPMPPATFTTSGSDCTTASNCSCSFAISAKETSCGASEVPNRVPVSCWGKKPLGMAMNSATVATRVARKTIKVMKRWRKTLSRPCS